MNVSIRVSTINIYSHSRERGCLYFRIYQRKRIRIQGGGKFSETKENGLCLREPGSENFSRPSSDFRHLSTKHSLQNYDVFLKRQVICFRIIVKIYRIVVRSVVFIVLKTCTFSRSGSAVKHFYVIGIDFGNISFYTVLIVIRT